MPVPALLTLALLSAASMGANYAGQKKVNKARTAALGEAREHRERNAKRAAETAQSTTDILIGTAAKEKAAAEDMLLKEQEARAMVNPVTGQALALPTSTVAPSGATSIVKDQATADARALRFRNQQAGARAKMGAFSDVMAGNALDITRNAEDISQVASNLQNWNQNVLPAQLNSANIAGRNWNTLADALQLAAMVYSPIALTKGAALKAGTTAASTTAGAGGTPLITAGTVASQPAAAPFRFYDVPLGQQIGPPF